MRVRLKIKHTQREKVTSSPHYTMWRPQYTIERMYWEINPYDNDDFPSVPHADSVEPYHTYKIDLLDGSGTIYCHREKCGRLCKADYKRLMKDIRKRNLIATARKYYREHNPHINLPIIDAERKMLHSARKENKEPLKYFFSGAWVKGK